MNGYSEGSAFWPGRQIHDGPMVGLMTPEEREHTEVFQGLAGLLLRADAAGLTVTATARRTWWRRLLGIGGRRLRLTGEYPVRISVTRP